MGNLVRDVRLAVRQLSRSSGFTLASVATLGLGIGAATTLFGLVHGILVAPLPFPEPDRLVLVRSADPPRDVTDMPVSLPDVRDWGERSSTTSAVGAYSTLPSRLVLQTETGARELRTTHVSAGFFRALAVAPALGRVFTEEDERGDPRVVVAAHAFWTDQLGADPGWVGRTLRLSDGDFRLIGVMPEGFTFPESGMEVWAPIAIIPQTSIPTEVRGVRFLDAVARLDRGVTPEQAQRDLSTVASALALEYADSNDEVRGVAIETLRSATVGSVERALLLALVAVGFVLVVACVNVANLVLTRSLSRSKEFAVRISLGAGRRHLVRMLAMESLMLGTLGGALGALLAWWATRGIQLLNAGVLPRIDEVGPSSIIFVFSSAIALVTVFASGLLPAVGSAGVDPASELRSGRTSGAIPALGARRGLVAAQFAASVVLLVGAGLLGRTLWELRSVDLGFDPNGALAVAVTIPASRYPEPAQYRAFHREALDRFAAIPGVESVGSIRNLPTRGTGESWDWTLPGEASDVASGRPNADVLQVTPGLLDAMGIELVRGRSVSDRDVLGALPVALVNETLADLAFGAADPLGRVVRFGDLDWTIVGVAGDVRQRGPAEAARPTIYVPNEQYGRRAMTFVLRTAGDPLALAQPILAHLREMDPGQAVTEIQTLEGAVAASVARPRFFALFLGALAGLTVALTAIGLYGVLAFLVRRRTPELGIRMALGATAGQVATVVLGESLRPVTAGLFVGLLISLGGAGLVRSLLFGVEPLDPWTFSGAILLLLLVAASATWIPTRRAAALDPLIALRSE